MSELIKAAPRHEGVYPEITNQDTGHAILVCDHRVEDKVYEVRVPVEYNNMDDDDRPEVIFTTDSAEVLRGVMARGFPLRELADAVKDSVQQARDDDRPEIVFDIVILRFDLGTPKDAKATLRVIRLRGHNEFELRAVK